MILFDNNYLISIIISLLLINGLYNVSFKLNFITKEVFQIENFFVGTIFTFFFITNILAITTFNLSLFFGVNKSLIQIISLIIILFGFYKPSYLLKFKKIFIQKNYKENLIYLILLLYFFLSLNPITDPDSLDYHITIPIYQLEFGNHQFSKHWPHSQLAGAGESLFLYSLALKGFHFSQILQFCALFFIVLIVLRFENKDIFINYEKRLYACLSILSLPVFLFLVASSKPQLFPIATNFLSLIFVVFFIEKLKNKNLILGVSFVVILLFCSTQMKFSFLLSSGLITIFLIYKVLDKNIFLKFSTVILIFFLLIILPREVFEFQNFNKDILYNFFNPITDTYAADAVNSSLRHGTGNSKYFILWLFIPYNQSGDFHLGQITYCLGPFALYFLFNHNFKKKLMREMIVVYFVFIISALFLAQPVGRFYVEIFIWMLFFSILYTNDVRGFLQNIFTKTLLAYSFCFVIILGYFSLNLFSGNISQKLNDKILLKNADGYSLSKWANEVIPDNSVIISAHRSKTFYKHEVVSYEFRLFGGLTKREVSYYLNEMAKKKPKYILYKSSEINTNNDYLQNCRGKLFKFKKNVGYIAGRNPFTTSKKFYDGYIYEISDTKIKDCIK